MSKLTYWGAFLVGGGAHAVATDVPGTHLVLVTKYDTAGIIQAMGSDYEALFKYKELPRHAAGG